jgi:hypothetical protein
MNDSEKYLEIVDEIDRCNFRIGVMSGQAGEESELLEVKEQRSKFETELLPFTEKLSDSNIDKADAVRIGYIAVFNHYIDIF